MALVKRVRQSIANNYVIPTSLTHNSGVITAQLNTSSFQVTLSSLTANTLYFLYLRSNAGVMTLFYDANVPSIYRGSYPDAFLVGAFYANGAGSPAWGSFVNIEGVPKSTRILFTTTLTGFGSPTSLSFYWQREGNEMITNGSFNAGTNNSVFYSSSMPSPYTLDTGLLPISGNTTSGAGSNVGLWLSNASGPQRTDALTAPGTSTSIIYAGGGNTTPLVPVSISNAFGSGQATSLMYRVPISGWTNIPLKDL